MLRVHGADERVRTRRQRWDRVVALLGAREHVGLEDDGPGASLIWTSCGMPASWLSNESVNGASAGAVTSVGSNAMFGGCDRHDLGVRVGRRGRRRRPGDALAPEANSSFQQSGYGVASGAGR